MRDDPEVLRHNWWQEGDPNSSTRGVVKSGNTIITSPDQTPASVLANAGVQVPYSSVLLWRPVSLQVLGAPDQPSILYAFNGTVYMTWHPSFAEGSSVVLFYTVSVCKGRAISNQGGCQEPALPPLIVTSGDLYTRGYASVAGLTDGRPYTFLVSATNAVGTSTNSIESSEFWPRSGVPGLPERPSRVAVHPGQDDVALLWYRPRNDPGVKLMAGTKDNRQPTRRTGKQVFVLSYRITSSKGQVYDLTGHEQLINTNTGFRVLDVIGGLLRGQKYRFSISAVNPAGVGPATTTYAVHEFVLGGVSPLWSRESEPLSEGKGVTARWGPEEAGATATT